VSSGYSTLPATSCSGTYATLPWSGSATSSTPPNGSPATQAVDAAVYALMQVLDGVTGGLTDGPRRVKLATTVSLIEDGEIIESLDLFDGDGMCMGFHMWRAGDFGESPVTSAT
jgi:hypothetical protein